MSEHGTRSKYTTDRCRCRQCREANTRYMAGWRRQRGVVPVSVPAGSARVAVDVLRYRGWTIADIARAADLTWETVYRVAAGAETTSPRTLSSLLSVLLSVYQRCEGRDRGNDR